MSTPISQVAHGKPHTSGRGWHITLNCGHSVYMFAAPVVGQQCRCEACNHAQSIRKGLDEGLLKTGLINVHEQRAAIDNCGGARRKLVPPTGPRYGLTTGEQS